MPGVQSLEDILGTMTHLPCIGAQWMDPGVVRRSAYFQGVSQMQVLTASQTITDCIKICEDQDTCTIGALYQISTINYCYQSEEWLQFISYPNTYSYSAIRKGPFSQLCPHGFISFLFMVKTKGDLNEDSMISLLSYDHIDQTSSSLDITLALGNDISTKISFDGEHLKEKPIEKDIASYRDFVEITIKCDNSMFNVYINGHLHDVYTDITPGFDPVQYTMETQSDKKNIEFVDIYYKMPLVNGIMGYYLYGSVGPVDTGFTKVGRSKATHISEYVEFFKSDWSTEVRYLTHTENQRCYRDVTRNLRCIYLDFIWHKYGGSGGLTINQGMPSCPHGFSHFINVH